jgi:succinate dehydrogenase / fumarate reductase flavoprotein subunit
VKLFCFQDSQLKAYSVAVLGVPFAQQYAGLLDNRSFAGTDFLCVLCQGTIATKLLLEWFSTMNRNIGRGKIQMFNRQKR